MDFLKRLLRRAQAAGDVAFTFARTSKTKLLFFVKYNAVKKEKVIFKMGGGTVIEKGVRFLLRDPGSFQMGAHSRICRDCKIVINGGDLTLGEHVTVGEKAIFNVFSDVVIADNVLMADKINFITNEHGYKDINVPINASPETARPIFIGSDSWIGINATILAGTTIGKHCVIGANSVVKGSYPDYCVIAGCPARIVKKYDADTGRWQSCTVQKCGLQ